MNNVEVKKRFRELQAQRKYSIEAMADKIITEMNLNDTIDEVLEVCLAMDQEELQSFIAQHNLSCPVCNTSEHLVCAPVVYDTEREEYTKKFEIYCANPNTDSSIFSRCWHHVYGYQYGIQQSVRLC